MSTRCPACGATALRAASTAPGYLACDTCQSAVLVEPQPTEALYGDDYFMARPDGVRGGYVNYAQDAALHRRNAAARLSLITARTGAAASRLLLDVGCASGETMAAARAAGFEPAGVEPNATMRAQAARVGLACGGVAELPSLLRGRPIDVACWFQSLEHDPDAAHSLAQVARQQAPGAWLVIETWARDAWIARQLGPRWHQVNPPTVVHQWTRRGMHALVTRAGYEVVRLRPSTKWISVRWAAGVVSPAIAARTGVLGDLPLPYHLGDLVTLVARRTATEPGVGAGE